MSRFDSKESIARKKKLQEEIEKLRGTNGTCARMNNSFYQANYTCASINKNVCMPASNVSSVSGSFKQTKTSSEKMFEQLAGENKKLTQEKIKLNLKVLELQKQLKEAIDDKNKYKAFAEAERGKVWKDLNKSIKEVFNNISNWFNS